MSTNHTPGPWLQFTKHRVYRPGERYSSGEGLSVMTQNRAEAEGLFARANDFADGRIYAVEVREMATGKVLLHSGPSMEEADRSMRAAIRAGRAAIAAATGEQT